jgi:alpha-beta hydrolase superfamily lysophospholipase
MMNLVEPYTFSFKTDDGTEIVTKKWIKAKDSKPKAIVQIAHGMAEHIARYDSFAKELVANNLFVFGNDHRGHGETAKKPNGHYGYFADENGFEKVVQDMHQLTRIIESEYPQTPIFLFGHSMGSFLSKRYIQIYGNRLSGVILSGTGGNPGIMGKLGKMIATREMKKIGRKTPSPLLHKLTFGNFNKAFRPNRTEFDWLTRDERQVNQYIDDPQCGGVFTSGFFYDFLDGLGTVHQPRNIDFVPSELPILLISGIKDPVGGRNGIGVMKSMQAFQQAGVRDVSIKLYEDARHELLNEINKNEVQKDIIDWIYNHLTD